MLHLHRRQTASVVFTVLALVLAPLGTAPALAAPPPGTRTLASGPSGFPARIDVLGSDGRRIVFANEYQGPDGAGYYVTGYGTVPVGGGVATPLAGSDDGVIGGSVAGNTLVYFAELGQPFWIDLETGRSGIGRDDSHGPSWQVAVPGGGAWAAAVGGQEMLLASTTTAPNAGPTVLSPLPGFGLSAFVAAADTHGIAAVSGTTVDYYSFVTRTVRRLDTAGAVAKGFTCTSATATAIGCHDDETVLRIPTDGTPPTRVPATGVHDLVVGPTATAWTVGESLNGRPLVVLPVGSLRPTSTPVRASGVAAVGNDFAYSRYGNDVAGVYRLDPAGRSVTRLLARAPALPRVTFRIALTPGRVAWTDDSTVGYPARSRRLLPGTGGLRLGPTVVTAPGTAHFPLSAGIGIDESASGLAASGSRTVFMGPGRYRASQVFGPVVLADAGGRHVLAPEGNGDVAISGARVVWSTPRGHVLVRNLATGRTRDLTPITGRDVLGGSGDLGAALYGRYLAFSRDGFAWRLDLASGRSVRIERTSASPGVGQVLTAGDWVLAQVGRWPTSRLHYRNARTLGPVRSVGRGWTPETVSQAGFVAATEALGAVFRAWGSTVDRALPRGGSVVTDGGLMAWIGTDGYPKVAPFAASAARPQALGAPLAAPRVRTGGSWTLDQPMSQVLGRCAVVIRSSRGAVVARLSCAAAAATEGEAVARWQVGRAMPSGVYTWQLVAANAVGPALSATGTPGTPIHGTLTVQP